MPTTYLDDNGNPIGAAPSIVYLDPKTGEPLPELPSRGLLQHGNIDLAHRPVVKNSNGSVSTVRSMSFEEDGQEILIPTVSDDGRILTDDQAKSLYRRTGRHLGKFADAGAATEYAQALHKQQEQMYVQTPLKKSSRSRKQIAADLLAAGASRTGVSGDPPLTIGDITGAVARGVSSLATSMAGGFENTPKFLVNLLGGDPEDSGNASEMPDDSNMSQDQIDSFNARHSETGEAVIERLRGAKTKTGKVAALATAVPIVGELTAETLAPAVAVSEGRAPTRDEKLRSIEGGSALAGMILIPRMSKLAKAARAAKAAGQALPVDTAAPEAPHAQAPPEVAPDAAEETTHPTVEPPTPAPGADETAAITREVTIEPDAGAQKAVDATFDADRYVKEKIADRELARKAGTPRGMDRVRAAVDDAKAKLVDFTAPIEDTLTRFSRATGSEVRPSRDISNAIDRTLRSPTIAGQFARDGGMEAVIREAPDLQKLDQYLVARQAIDVENVGLQNGSEVLAKQEAEAQGLDVDASAAYVAQRAPELVKESTAQMGRGLGTGRDLELDGKLIDALKPEYEPLAQRVNEYSRKLLDYAVDSGLVSREHADFLKERYPRYVPLQRVFSEVEQASGGSGDAGGGGVASLSKQTVVRKLKGSVREIENPIEELMAKTTDAFIQGERNKAARMLASYADLPGNPFNLRELAKGESAPHTISFLDAGEKRTFATSPEIATAAKALDVQRLNILQKVISFPTRIARVGITGVNPSFLIANIARDQVTQFINSQHGLATSLANPYNFSQALFEAVSHRDLYDEMLREGALGTSFDMSREQIPRTIENIRAERNAAGRLLYIARHPAHLLRVAEDVLARGEELTRIQQYAGTKAKRIAEGMPEPEARIAAAKAAREATVNFARRGEWGTALNSMFLYLNAGIQGSRTLLRSLQNRPLPTSAKLAAAVYLPIAIATAWNMKDPDRRAAYEDIQDYEKENNIIILPPHPSQDDRGRWNVIKVPISQEVNNIGNVPRRILEQAYGADPMRAGEVFSALVGTVSPIAPTKGAAISTLTPQFIKPTAEAYLNKNFFTNREIVPHRMRDLDPEDQVRDDTSGTARMIGHEINVSPITVEEWLKETYGGTAMHGLNAADSLLYSFGKIPKEQVGGETVPAAINRRFGKASGGKSK